MARFKGFVGGSYLLRNNRYDSQRTINMYPEVDESHLGKNAEIAQLTRTAGTTWLLAGTSGEGGAEPGKALYLASNGTLFYVAESTLRSIEGVDGSDAGWSMSGSLGDVDAYNEEVFMCDNGIDLFITTTAGQGWTYNFDTAAFTAIAGVSPSGCTFFDGYVVFPNFNTNQFYWTDLYSTNVDGLNFASAESNPDKLIALINNNEDLWLFGEKTTELWYDAGQGTTVFARRPGVLVETGCASPSSLVKINSNRLMWMAQDDRGGPYIAVSNGYGAQRASTFAIEQTWSNLKAEDIYKSTAYSYMQDGHMFYALNVPGVNSTWVYDVTTSDMLQTPTWHERVWTDTITGQFSRNRANSHAFYLNKHIITDYLNGDILYLDQNSFTDGENADPITRQRIAPHISNDGKRIIYNRLQFDFKTGMGNPDFLQPQVMLEWSNDGGNTWSNPVYRSVGAQGNYNARVVYNQLGQGRDRVFKLTMTDPIDWAVSGAAIDLSPGSY
jgi:hypothetical protein